MNHEDKHFGDKGLEQAVAIFRQLPSQEFIDKLVERVDHFAGTAPQFDDMTGMIATVLARKPAPAAPDPSKIEKMPEFTGKKVYNSG